jgi:hypothetical protein
MSIGRHIEVDAVGTRLGQLTDIVIANSERFVVVCWSSAAVVGSCDAIMVIACEY